MVNKKFTEKQIHILNVAEKLIAKKGFEGTSVRDICSEAHINVAMISYYFGSKEKMMSYLYRYRVQKTCESFAEFAEQISGGTPEMQMKELIKYVVTQLFHYSYFHGFVTQELRHTDHLKQELQPDLYAATLAETAAYTTDKKILYQLINKPQELTEFQIKLYYF